MEDNPTLFDTLLERAADYGKTSYELAKLQAVEKTSDVVSSCIPYAAFLVFICTFLLFLSLGLAFWFGQILGNIYFGFFAVSAFYGLTGILVHLFLHRWLKKRIRNFYIKQILK